jgi:hypothetical protein
LPHCQIAVLLAIQQFGKKAYQQSGNQFVQPIIKGGYFLTGLSVLVIFLRRLPGRERMSIGGALLEGDRGNLKAMYGDGGAGIGQNIRGAGRHCIEDNISPLARQLRYAGGRPYRTQVQDAGTAWYQNQVGDFGRGKGNLAGMGGSIQKRYISTPAGCGLDSLRQPRCRDRDNNGDFILAAIFPPGRACLGV